MCGEVKVVKYIQSRSLDLLDQQKIVLTCNIGHISDICRHVYHLDCHEVLFHNYIFVFKTFCKTLVPGPSASCDHSNGNIIVASSNMDTFNYNLPPTYTYPACLLSTNICSLISKYIVNHQECFKKIIRMVILSIDHHLSWEEQDCSHLES